jgi:alanine racemase
VSGVECGDVLTCLGIDGDDEITLRDLAVAGGTIEYEVLTGFGRRLPRVYRGGEGS